MEKILNHSIRVSVFFLKKFVNQLFSLKIFIYINNSNLLVGLNIPNVELKATVAQGLGKKDEQIVVK